MTDSATAGIQITEVRVPGANCPWCFNAAMARVRELNGVVNVRASIVSECIEVRHRDVPMSSLLDTLRTYLHGTDDSSHECQMVTVEPEVVASPSSCTHGTEVTDRYLKALPARPMETLVEAMRRLRSSGYTYDFVASPTGGLICRTRGISQEPETVEIRETVRFEGESNPDDQAILLALSCPDGCRGQYSAAFGPGTAAADVKALVRLTPTRK